MKLKMNINKSRIIKAVMEGLDFDGQILDFNIAKKTVDSQATFNRYLKLSNMTIDNFPKLWKHLYGVPIHSQFKVETDGFMNTKQYFQADRIVDKTSGYKDFINILKSSWVQCPYHKFSGDGYSAVQESTTMIAHDCYINIFGTDNKLNASDRRLRLKTVHMSTHDKNVLLEVLQYIQKQSFIMAFIEEYIKKMQTIIRIIDYWTSSDNGLIFLTTLYFNDEGDGFSWKQQYFILPTGEVSYDVKTTAASYQTPEIYKQFCKTCKKTMLKPYMYNVVNYNGTESLEIQFECTHKFPGGLTNITKSLNDHWNYLGHDINFQYKDAKNVAIWKLDEQYGNLICYICRKLIPGDITPEKHKTLSQFDMVVHHTKPLGSPKEPYETDFLGYLLITKI